MQGDQAPQSIVDGIEALDALGCVDVIIVGRGGGSIEDLWAFNEEIVARAIWNCKTPVISAVGHETDTTIADYVADLRAPTPSAGAELAVILATADDVSVRGAGKAAELLADNGLKDCRLLLNRYSVKAAKKGRLLTADDAMERTFLRLLGVVPEDKTIGPAWEQKPNSPARQAFRRVADRLDGKNVPFLLSKIK